MSRFAKFLGVGFSSFLLTSQARWLVLASDERKKETNTESYLNVSVPELKLFSVTEETELANEIAFYLKTRIGKLQVVRKSDNEKPTVNIFEDVNSKVIYLICSFDPAQGSISKPIQDLATAISTIKTQSPSKVNVILPYYGDSNQHGKVRDHSVFSPDYLSGLLEGAGADKIITVNMGDDQLSTPSHIPLVKLDAHKLCASYFKRQQLKDLVLVYENQELESKVNKIKSKLESDGHKVELGKLQKRSGSTKFDYIGEAIEGRDVIIVDNIVDSGKPVYNAARYLERLGAHSIQMFATHGVIDDETIDFIDHSPIKQLVITNTLPLDSTHLSPKINQISVAKMLANIIAQSTFQKNLQELYHDGTL